jgi:hypothetical protein
MVDPDLRDRPGRDPRDIVDGDERAVVLVARREQVAFDVERLARALVGRQLPRASIEPIERDLGPLDLREPRFGDIVALPAEWDESGDFRVRFAA